MRARRSRKSSRVVVLPVVAQKEAKPDLEHVKIAHLEMIQREAHSCASIVNGLRIAIFTSASFFFALMNVFYGSVAQIL
jgi:hypothetical protein